MEGEIENGKEMNNYYFNMPFHNQECPWKVALHVSLATNIFHLIIENNNNFKIKFVLNHIQLNQTKVDLFGMNVNKYY